MYYNKITWVSTNPKLLEILPTLGSKIEVSMVNL